MTWATATWLLLAIMAVQLTRSSYMAVGSSIVAGLIAFAVLLGVRRALHRPLSRTGVTTRRRLTYAVGASLVAAIVIASSLSILHLAGEEIVLLGLLALASALFVCADDNPSLRQTALTSAVVVPFSLPGIGEACRLPLILGATACGALWFMVSINASPKDRWSWTYAMAMIVMLISVCLLAHHQIQPTVDENPWYAAWVPTSGGNGAGDENARRGTGDGPDEISGHSAESIGFDHGETFSESGRDGLYDLWVESYGQPVTSQDQQKMVGLNQDNLRILHGNDRENLKVGRTFAMHRQRNPEAPTSRADVAAEAKVWIKGPLPVHVPLAVFHDFDGWCWHVLDHGRPLVPARRLDDSAWMELLHRPISPAFSGTNEYEIRVGDLGGDVLPMPPLVERFKMGRVMRPDFFASTRSGLVRLARRTVPVGATLSVVSRHVSPSRLAGLEPALPKHSDSSVLDTHFISEHVRMLAMQWGQGRQRGWRQIRQVLEQLRSQVALDRNAHDATMSPPVDPIHHLLFVSRKGADYQIASAAVMLLRSLGYPTRLVSGFYANPADLDQRSGYVALDADDLHFWIEVRLADGTWITVDPTPGYPLLNLPMPPREWLTTAWHGARSIVTAHPLAFGAFTCGLAVILLTRRRWIDAIATTVCRLRAHDPLLVLRVIELRARLVRRPRPPGMTVGRWLNSLDRDGAVLPFIRELNRLLYCDHACAGRRAESGHGKAALDRLTLRTLRFMSR